MGLGLVIAMVPTIPLLNHSKTELKSVGISNGFGLHAFRIQALTVFRWSIISYSDLDLNSVIKAGYSNGQSNNVTALMT